MDISVSLCTHNNAASLERTLASLHALEVPAGIDWELLLIDNGSTDATSAVAKAWADRLPMVYLFEGRLGLSVARNRSLAAARGDLVIFIDDDVEAVPGWLTAYWQAFQADTGGNYYFGGPLESRFEAGAPDPELLRLAMPSIRGLDYGESGEVSPAQRFAGANWAAPASALRQCSGFDESRGLVAGQPPRVGEERAMTAQLRDTTGLRPYYIAAARLLHHVPAAKCSFAHVASRAWAHNFQVGRRMAARSTAPTIAGVPRWLYRQLAEASVAALLASVSGRHRYRARLKLVRIRARIAAFRAGGS